VKSAVPPAVIALFRPLLCRCFCCFPSDREFKKMQMDEEVIDVSQQPIVPRISEPAEIVEAQRRRGRP